MLVTGDENRDLLYGRAHSIILISITNGQLHQKTNTRPRETSMYWIKASKGPTKIFEGLHGFRNFDQLIVQDKGLISKFELPSLLL